jgi:hypothetical protein
VTQQEKRIKIAEACEFKPLEFVPPKRGEFILEQNNFRRWKKAGKTFHTDDLPDYFKDLNACHDMEKVVLENAGSWVRYVKEIKVQSCLTGLPHFHIPAAERAEAFGKTLNLW